VPRHVDDIRDRGCAESCGPNRLQATCLAPLVHRVQHTLGNTRSHTWYQALPTTPHSLLGTVLAVGFMVLICCGCSLPLTHAATIQAANRCNLAVFSAPCTCPWLQGTPIHCLQKPLW
jgi:hypothetical protein